MRTAPVVHTAAGDVSGFWQTETSAAFLGIPFAEPPVGELRFAAPVPRKPWDGTFEATSYGSTPQRRQLMAVTAIPEPSIPGDDTLLVNVFTPSLDGKRPVYVWIHGGGYTAGSPASPWYNGRAFNRDGIVTVTISYRLGFIGFGHVDGAPENRGVLDWIAALEWVRDNIAAFGGDPDDVTIGGQSAGGGAVLTLMACPAAQSLFHKAIVHSGAAADIPLERAKESSAKIAEICGIEPTLEAFSGLAEDAILDAQDKLSAEAMSGGNPADMLGSMIRREPAMLGFGPVVDGEFIPARVDEQLASIGTDKPMLIGSTENEFNMITSQAPKAANLVPAATMLHKGGLDKAVAKAYSAARPGKSMAVLGQFLTDAMFHVPLLEYCRVHKDSWAFEFTWKHDGQSPHCLDLPFAWDCLDAEQVEQNTGPNPPQALADDMHADWVRFIRTGEPGWGRFVEDEVGKTYDLPSVVGPIYQVEQSLEGPLARK